MNIDEETLQMQLCPHCGAEVPKGDFICSECNGSVRQIAPFTPVHPIVQSKIFKFVEAITLLFAVVAVLSPFLAIIGPFVFMRLSSASGTNDIEVREAWVRPITLPAGHSMENMSSSDMPDTPTAAYMVIENKGNGNDRLIRIATNVAETAEIHQTQIDNQGVVRMQPYPDGIEIPANATVTIEPGSYHIMLTGIKESLEVGETIVLMLTFESGQEIVIDALVSELPPAKNE